MEPKTPGMDPFLMRWPALSDRKNTLIDWNKISNYRFKFMKGQPGVYLTCKNGFNHFTCDQDIFIKCTGDYRFSVYSVSQEDSKTKVLSKIADDVPNTHFGCDPCPNGYEYKEGYESRTYETNLGGFEYVPDEFECMNKCEAVNCKTFAYSPILHKCKLHSRKIAAPSKSKYEDYKLCVKKDNDVCDSKIPESSCCNTVRVSSSGKASGFTSNRFGKYVEEGIFKNRIYYRQEGGSNVLYYPGDENYGWVVASSLESLGVLRSNPNEESVCPDETTFTWKYWTGEKWEEDKEFNIECSDPCPIDSEYVDGFLDVHYGNSRGTYHNIGSIDLCNSLCILDAHCNGLQYSKEKKTCLLARRVLQAEIKTTRIDDNIICKYSSTSVCSIKNTRVVKKFGPCSTPLRIICKVIILPNGNHYLACLKLIDAGADTGLTPASKAEKNTLQGTLMNQLFRRHAKEEPRSYFGDVAAGDPLAGTGGTNNRDYRIDQQNKDSGVQKMANLHYQVKGDSKTKVVIYYERQKMDANNFPKIDKPILQANEQDLQVNLPGMMMQHIFDGKDMIKLTEAGLMWGTQKTTDITVPALGGKKPRAHGTQMIWFAIKLENYMKEKQGVKYPLTLKMEVSELLKKLHGENYENLLPPIAEETLPFTIQSNIFYKQQDVDTDEEAVYLFDEQITLQDAIDHGLIAQGDAKIYGVPYVF